MKLSDSDTQPRSHAAAAPVTHQQPQLASGGNSIRTGTAAADPLVQEQPHLARNGGNQHEGAIGQDAAAFGMGPLINSLNSAVVAGNHQVDSNDGAAVSSIAANDAAKERVQGADNTLSNTGTAC